MLEKIKYSKEMISSMMGLYKNPCILCSFGKDSMVLLHLLRGLGHHLPVVFYKMPFGNEKYQFAEKIMREWNLQTYDYPPSKIGFDADNGFAHAIQYQQIGGGQLFALPMGMVPFQEGESFLCAIDDFFKRPCGSFQFPWDLCFHGHKGTDLDPVTGKIGLKVDVHQVAGSNDYAYPLRYWTDADIWQYTEENKVPINIFRYEKTNSGWSDIKSKKLNPDYFSACWKCVDKNESESVFCPKKKCEVSNVSASITYDKLNLSYMERDENYGKK